MAWYFNVLILLVIIVVIVFIATYRLRKKLLFLWKEVTSKEVIFYKQLEQVTKLFYENRDLLRTEDNNDFIRGITRYRKKKIRSLLLSTRQELYKAINIIYNEIEEKEEPEYILLQEEFDQLQKVRRIYNSKVLIYNQTISVFPTRYLALRMNLELREYFG